MSEHTPWSVSCTRRTMDGQGWYRIVGDEGRREIAYVPFGDRTQAEYVECTKHARLLAAAPDFYEAASSLIEAWDGRTTGAQQIVTGKSDRELQQQAMDSIDRLRAAIAKATGQ